jgi:aryl-phospho-beta-D-glucosidase BglC (GH1 family)
MKKITFLFLVAHLVPILLFAQAKTGAERVLEMGRGINLGNVLSAPSEGDWATPVTEQYFIDVKNAGFTNVRIPVDFFGTRTTGDWSGESTFEGDNSYSASSGTEAEYTGETFTIDANYLLRVAQVIDWALNQGLVTILDFHGQHLKSDFIKTYDTNESAYTDPTSARRAADNAKFRAIWTKLADTFKDKDHKLVFEIINEPYFHMNKDDMDTLNADILDIITLGGNNPERNIIVTGGGPETSYEAIENLDPTLFDDSPNRLIGSFHYYKPFLFTSSSGDDRDTESWGSSSDKTNVDEHFTSVKSWTDDNDVPVFLGEFGADNTGGYNYSTGDLNAVSANDTGFADGGPDNTSKVAYMKYVAELAITNGFAFAAWDAGPKSNKTINKRTDSPLTENFDRSEFSVTTYSPKSTTVSTVLDTSVWVEDVRYALVNPLSNSKNLLYLNNPTFTSGASWSGTGVSNCTENEVGVYDENVTHTADGSGSWKINACDNSNNRLQTSAKITVPTAGSYTFTSYVKGEAGQLISPYFFTNPNTTILSNEGDYTIVTTGAWEKVVRTFTLSTDDASVRIRLKTVNTSVHVDDVSLVLTSDAELINSRSAITSKITSAYDGDWEDGTTWEGGVVPDSHKVDVIINDEVVLKSAVKVNDLTLGDEGRLTINATKSINIANNLVINNPDFNSIIFNVGGNGPALLKIGGTYGPSGNRILYKHKMLNANFNQKWLLIASPLENATINHFITLSTTLVTRASPASTAFADYDDSRSAGSKYAYVANPYPNTTDVFVDGKGYATQLDATGTTSPILLFRGKIQDTSPIAYSISGAGDGFNLVGNPYSTWLFANKTSTSATNNLLTANTAVLEEETIWIWDSLNSTYITKNQDDDAFRIAPTQGFFIKSASGSSSFSFAENMQTLTTQTYYRTSNTNTRFEINLFAATNDDQRNTTVRYINNRTTSFDNGSDSSLFGGDDLTIYTELVENNTGKKLAIQSLPNSNFENMVIPVGVSISEGSEITFTADALNIPANYKVYLEDRVTNIVTRLDEANSEYVVFIESGNTSGRFYLHAKTSSPLITDTNNLSTVSMFTTSNSNLRVQGLHEGDGSILIFNILGEEMFKTSFKGNGANDITLPKLASSIYIIKLNTQYGTINKKIIIQ